MNGTTPNVPMSTTMDAHFTRVERALETLIKSLSTYNPSPSLAQSLVLADSELNEGLEQLHKHQTNYTNILSLRALSTDLDAQIKDALLLLTTTRSEVLSTPGTKFSENTNPVKYEELLSYARRISRTTLPGTYREAADESAVRQRDGTPKEGGSNTNGNSTPVGTTTVNGIERDVSTAAAQTAAADGDEVKDGGGGGGEHSTALPPQFIPATTLPPTVFMPWPHDVLLRRGALATIQVLAEKGENIEGYDGEEGEGEERKRAASVMEGEQRKRRESTVIVPVLMSGHAESHHHASSHGAGGGGGQVQKPKKAFELETFEDDDDEEDD